MSARGTDFLETWMAGNVTEADKYGSHERARELAQKCLGDAKAARLTVHDMELELNGLETAIHEKMHHGFDG